MSQLPAPSAPPPLARIRSAFAPAAPEVSAARWHVSPGVDTLAYAYSWLLLLVPFWFMGPRHPEDYLWYWVLGNAFSFGHRHLTLPYVYLDRQVFSTQAARFLVVPSLLFAGFLASGLYRSWRVPAGFFTTTDALVLAAAGVLLLQWRLLDQHLRPSRPLLASLIALPLCVLAGLLWWPAGIEHSGHVLAIGGVIAAVAVWMGREGRETTPFVRAGAPVLATALLLLAVWTSAHGAAALGPASRVRVPLVLGGIAAFAGAWNIWHVYMQKYGILRMYAAKSGPRPEARAPGWVDRWLVFGWLPAYLLYLPTAARPLLDQHAPTVLPWLEPLLVRLDAAAAVGLPLALAFGAASVTAFMGYELRAARTGAGLNPARLVMGSGTVLLALTFFAFDPFEVYVAFGFSHAVEYVVFVWAFSRRRYREPLAHQPLLGRLLSRPLAYYLGFFLLVGGGYAAIEYGSGTLYEGRPRLFGTPLRSWVFYWTVWQSMAHFYFDSFLWKMRLPSVRAAL